jgi:glycosyltransferase involved in cell wall biosynthesis
VPPTLSIVIPAYREADHLHDSLQAIRTVATGLNVPFEIVVVDDGSPDTTWKILESLSSQWPELRALRLARNFGKEASLMAGLTASAGKAVIIMDADLQHPPALIPEMFRLWADGGWDVVNAVKRTRGNEGWLRKKLAGCYYALFGRLAGIEIANSADFKLLSRRVVDTVCSLPERNTFFRGLVSWVGFRQTSLPFDVEARAGGVSTWSTVKLARLAVNSLVSFSTIPLQAVTLMGLAFLVFALVLGIQTLWAKITGEAVEGFTTIILLLLIIGAVLMIALGIIGQYLAKIYDEVKRRPRYLINGAAPADERGETVQSRQDRELVS